jgi:tRNA wybutosine-synthesizing protein 1
MTSRPSSIFLASLAVGVTVATWVVYEEIQRRRRRSAEIFDRRNENVNGAADPWSPGPDHRPPPVREVLGDEYDDADKERARRYRRILSRGTVTIVHASLTGTCRRLAYDLAQSLARENGKGNDDGDRSNHSNPLHIQVASVEDLDWWDELVNDDNEDNEEEETVVQAKQKQYNKKDPAILVLLISTYTDGSWPPSAVHSLEGALRELLTDWRIAKFPLKCKLNVCVFGTGSSEYTTSIVPPGTKTNTITTTTAAVSTPSMGRPAREALALLHKLGARCLVPLRVGDDAVGNHLQESFEEWQGSVVSKLREARAAAGGWSAKTNHSKQPPLRAVKESSGKYCHGESSTDECCQSSSPDDFRKGEYPVTSREESQNELDENGEDEDRSEYESDDDDDDDNREPEVMDLEDMGDSIAAASQSKSSSASPGAPPREMVTPSQAKSLKKEGYRLIGSHSAVKLCRWTKHQLRGRGGCYKHTFYGITSYQCMEATPSLACANKCVFCWRHHKNPVGKEWRWKTDDPHYIVDEAVKTHVQMIKEARGIPGVQMDRWKEAHTVRHCALSLVGEPIMYPRIDELLGDLHSRRISTFLVTNGQHPSAIAGLRPITQLYVSVDAPTRESLIAIDRPLFSDAWERLSQSLESLRDKGQRTVARLTVVKGWNSDELEGYARLIALGCVSLVEVKGTCSLSLSFVA